MFINYNIFLASSLLPKQAFFIQTLYDLNNMPHAFIANILVKHGIPVYQSKLHVCSFVNKYIFIDIILRSVFEFNHLSN